MQERHKANQQLQEKEKEKEKEKRNRKNKQQINQFYYKWGGKGFVIFQGKAPRLFF